MNHFNICPSCIHRNFCALTTRKDKVWSCSDFDEIEPKQTIKENTQQPKRVLELS